MNTEEKCLHLRSMWSYQIWARTTTRERPKNTIDITALTQAPKELVASYPFQKHIQTDGDVFSMQHSHGALKLLFYSKCVLNWGNCVRSSPLAGSFKHSYVWVELVISSLSTWCVRKKAICFCFVLFRLFLRAFCLHQLMARAIG